MSLNPLRDSCVPLGRAQGHQDSQCPAGPGQQGGTEPEMSGRAALDPLSICLSVHVPHPPVPALTFLPTLPSHLPPLSLKTVQVFLVVTWRLEDSKGHTAEWQSSRLDGWEGTERTREAGFGQRVLACAGGCGLGQMNTCSVPQWAHLQDGADYGPLAGWDSWGEAKVTENEEAGWTHGVSGAKRPSVWMLGLCHPTQMPQPSPEAGATVNFPVLQMGTRGPERLRPDSRGAQQGHSQRGA